MNILIISQYFWPENFKINDVAKGLVAKGYNVSVLTGLPNYPKGKIFEGYSFPKNKKENYDGITIYRSPVIPRGSGSGVRLFFNYFSKTMFLTPTLQKIMFFIYICTCLACGPAQMCVQSRF